jgi:hypothetical protein
MRLERQMKRLKDAELDPILALGTFMHALEIAGKHGAGLYEAKDIALDGSVVLIGRRKDLPPDLRSTLESIYREANRTPGFTARLFRRRRADQSAVVDAAWLADTVENREP